MGFIVPAVATAKIDSHIDSHVGASRVQTSAHSHDDAFAGFLKSASHGEKTAQAAKTGRKAAATADTAAPNSGKTRNAHAGDKTRTARSDIARKDAARDDTARADSRKNDNQTDKADRTDKADTGHAASVSAKADAKDGAKDKDGDKTGDDARTDAATALALQTAPIQKHDAPAPDAQQATTPQDPAQQGSQQQTADASAAGAAACMPGAAQPGPAGVSDAATAPVTAPANQITGGQAAVGQSFGQQNTADAAQSPAAAGTTSQAQDQQPHQKADAALTQPFAQVLGQQAGQADQTGKGNASTSGKSAAKDSDRKDAAAGVQPAANQAAQAQNSQVQNGAPQNTQPQNTQSQNGQPDPAILASHAAGPHGQSSLSTGTSAGAATAAANAALPQHLQVSSQAPNMGALGVAIAARSLSGSRQFDIRLDPPELGRVDVRLSIDAAGKASAHLSADQQNTLDLLQKDSSGLARALRDAGLNVSQDGLNFSLRQQPGQGQNPGGFTPRGRAQRQLSLGASVSATATSAALGAASRFTAGDSRLDIRV